MTLLQQLIEINNLIDRSVSSTVNKIGDIDYRIESPTDFYNGVSLFNELKPIEENSQEYLGYLDTEVRIKNIFADIKDRPMFGVPIDIKEYKYSKNTTQLAKEFFGGEDGIAELYLVNNVNSDFELISQGKIIVQSQDSST